jgi:hypothetical protein
VQHVRRDNLPAFANGESVVLLSGALPPPPSSPCTLRPVYDAFGPTSIEYRAHWHRDKDCAILRGFLDLLAKRQGTRLPN